LLVEFLYLHKARSKPVGYQYRYKFELSHLDLNEIPVFQPMKN